MLNRKALALAAVFTALSILLMACGPSVSQTDYDAAKAAAQAQQQKNQQLQQQLSDKDKQMSDLQQKLDAALKQPAQPAPASGAPSGAKILIGVAPVPTASGPAPTPTALPPNFTPPPPAKPPASIYEPVPYSVYVEVLATTTPSKYGLASTVACTASSVFKRGQKMVWRFEVIDTKTGKRITDLDTNMTVKVHLPQGDDIAGRFSQRGGGRIPDAAWMWSAAWDIPPDYPVGGLDFTILVTNKDNNSTYTWKQPVMVSAASGQDTRPKIID